MTRITVIPYTFYRLIGSNHQNEDTIIFFFSMMITTFAVMNSIIECKLLFLFCCYILICMCIENKCFEAKWVLMHLQFCAQEDDHTYQCKSKETKKIENEVANFKKFITNILYFIHRSVALVIAHIRAIELEKIVGTKMGAPEKI